MILTQQEKREIVSSLQLNVGDWSRNGLSVANAVEAAVLAKLADKLRDAERYQKFTHYLAGDHTHLDDDFAACTTVEQISAICDKHLSTPT
jgi:hypothetical protein